MGVVSSTSHDEWGRDVVRKVRHHRPPGFGSEQRGPVDRERVALLDAHPLSGQHLPQHRHEMPVELERDDLRRAGVAQREGE